MLKTRNERVDALCTIVDAFADRAESADCRALRTVGLSMEKTIVYSSPLFFSSFGIDFRLYTVTDGPRQQLNG